MTAETGHLDRMGLRRRVAVAVVVSLTGVAAIVPLVAHGAAAHPVRQTSAAAQRIQRLEFEGYVVSRCTRDAMVLVEPSTGRRVSVRVG